MYKRQIQELRQKKEWYKKQPRGSGPTAKDIRKEKEQTFHKKKDSKVRGNSNKFTPDDFAPLEGASSNTTTAATNNTWVVSKPAGAGATE